MAPTLRAGDRLRVDRTAYRRRAPATGDIVVLIDPEKPDRWLVKRVVRFDPARQEVEVRGDAGVASRDSRRFGPVPLGAIVGRAYRLYAPFERRREL